MEAILTRQVIFEKSETFYVESDGVLLVRCCTKYDIIDVDDKRLQRKNLYILIEPSFLEGFFILKSKCKRI